MKHGPASTPPPGPLERGPLGKFHSNFDEVHSQVTKQQPPPQQQLIHLHVLATTDNMIEGSSTPSNMGRGAYDTTGCPKPPPRPRPS
ncbi:hypothetical protein BFJ63_vAg8850 [Fusarium oxysporum f. sp. narcissi]|uniref:Uncharacterized protein n=1 Tax=Fusarium oxysporum f. sp. narcissi TaxID=451672 RepID=A0A4Q2VP26_FUSOX|nr:hypothetical protein BFJ71_g13642 [Fusarium oxysporum]RYC88290.1 hypothetical protein BFJ63_vAg8850 [Fusarium oxysporum f. sp. narcissi]